MESQEYVPQERALASTEEGFKQVGEVQISETLYAIYKKECAELLDLLERDLRSWRKDVERVANIRAVHAIHSLAGSSATVGLLPLQEIAFAIESIFYFVVQQPTRLTESQFDLLGMGYDTLRSMLSQVEKGHLPSSEVPLITSLQQVLHDMGAPPANMPVDMSPIDAGQNPPELERASDVDRAMAIIDIDPVLPQSLPQALLVDAFLTSRFEEDVMALHDAPDPDLLPVFIEEASTATSNFEALRLFSSNAISPLNFLNTPDGSLLVNFME